MKINSYEDLTVWQKSLDLVVETYCLIRLLPAVEEYALSNQMRREVVSIPSNIAEGYQRPHTKDYIRFLAVSRGSNAELQTQLIICTRLNYLSCEQVSKAMEISKEIGKMLNSMISGLSNRLS